MRPHLFLLLTLLGPGSTLPVWDTRADGAKEIRGPPPGRGRRQVTTDDDYDEDFVDYTDPPETLEDPEFLTTTGTVGQRGSAGPGTPEPATAEAATRDSAGLGAGGTAVDLATELTSVIVPTTEAPSTTGSPHMEAVTVDVTAGPVATKAETFPPAATEAETTPVLATQAETSPPAATEAETAPASATQAETTPVPATQAETSPPAATEVETTPASATQVETSPPAITEVETTPAPVTTEAPSMKFVVVEPLSTEPVTLKSRSPESTTSTTTFLVTYKGATLAASNLSNSSLQNREVAFPGGSLVPGPTGASDLIPVRQCLLAILILALVATVFFVCTVVLAVRLSRKSHMYPVRNYSPTEMVCISSLLPDGGEGAPTAANGGLTKSQGLKAEAGEDRDGDDLTLHSFLP